VKFLGKSMVFRIILAVLVIVVVVGMTTACSNQKKEEIVFAYPEWNSIRVHSHIASIILEEGYGYDTDVMAGQTITTLTGHIEGDIDVFMEQWPGNYKDAYEEAIEDKDIIEVSVNFDDDMQGVYVPAYVIEGDSERDIEPMAPELKTVKDLKNEKYADLFEDPDDRKKGRIYGPAAGAYSDKILTNKMEAYGLDEYYNYMRSGSHAALFSSLDAAYKKGKPWVGYCWEPSWIAGKLDLILLEDEEFDPDKLMEGLCAFNSQRCTVTVHKDLPETAPEVVDFLSNYETSSELTSEFLQYMQNNEAEPEETAKYFLKEYEEVWTEWVSDDVAEKVRKAIK
jgi:glycine betaine/proline transport system substrate-binding protein